MADIIAQIRARAAQEKAKLQQSYGSSVAALKGAAGKAQEVTVEEARQAKISQAGAAEVPLEEIRERIALEKRRGTLPGYVPQLGPLRAERERITGEREAALGRIETWKGRGTEELRAQAVSGERALEAELVTGLGAVSAWEQEETVKATQVQQAADQAKADFEAKNIEVAPGKWYDRTFWASLTPSQRAEVIKTGQYTVPGVVGPAPTFGGAGQGLTQSQMALLSELASKGLSPGSLTAIADITKAGKYYTTADKLVFATEAEVKAYHASLSEATQESLGLLTWTVGEGSDAKTFPTKAAANAYAASLPPIATTGGWTLYGKTFPTREAAEDYRYTIPRYQDPETKKWFININRELVNEEWWNKLDEGSQSLVRDLGVSGFIGHMAAADESWKADKVQDPKTGDWYAKNWYETLVNTKFLPSAAVAQSLFTVGGMANVYGHIEDVATSRVNFIDPYVVAGQVFSRTGVGLLEGVGTPPIIPTVGYDVNRLASDLLATGSTPTSTISQIVGLGFAPIAAKDAVAYVQADAKGKFDLLVERGVIPTGARFAGEDANGNPTYYPPKAPPRADLTQPPYPGKVPLPGEAQTVGAPWVGGAISIPYKDLAIGLVPVVSTVYFWDDMSWGWRAASVGMDVLVLAGGFGAYLRMAGAGMKTSAIAREFLLAPIKFPASAVTHPIRTAKDVLLSLRHPLTTSGIDEIRAFLRTGKVPLTVQPSLQQVLTTVERDADLLISGTYKVESQAARLTQLEVQVSKKLETLTSIKVGDPKFGSVKELEKLKQDVRWTLQALPYSGKGTYENALREAAINLRMSEFSAISLSLEGSDLAGKAWLDTVKWQGVLGDILKKQSPVKFPGYKVDWLDARAYGKWPSPTLWLPSEVPDYWASKLIGVAGDINARAAPAVVKNVAVKFGLGTKDEEALGRLIINNLRTMNARAVSEGKTLTLLNLSTKMSTGEAISFLELVGARQFVESATGRDLGKLLGQVGGVMRGTRVTFGRPGKPGARVGYPTKPTLGMPSIIPGKYPVGITLTEPTTGRTIAGYPIHTTPTLGYPDKPGTPTVPSKAPPPGVPVSGYPTGVTPTGATPSGYPTRPSVPGPVDVSKPAIIIPQYPTGVPTPGYPIRPTPTTPWEPPPTPIIPTISIPGYPVRPTLPDPWTPPVPTVPTISIPGYFVRKTLDEQFRPTVPKVPILPREVPTHPVLPEDLSKKRKEKEEKWPVGTVVWRQGRLKESRYKIIFPPYDQLKPLDLARGEVPSYLLGILPDKGTPQETVKVIGGPVPKDIRVDLGEVDAFIRAGAKVPTITYKGRGMETDVGIRIAGPSQGISIYEYPEGELEEDRTLRFLERRKRSPIRHRGSSRKASLGLVNVV